MSQTTTHTTRTITPGSLLARVGIAVGMLLSVQTLAHAGLVVREWGAAIDGSWTVAGNWLPVGVPGATDLAVLGLTGPYTVTYPTTGEVGGLSIENPDATLTINAGRTLNLLGGSLNDGTIIVNTTNSTSFTVLEAMQNLSVEGSGTIVLNGPNGTWARLGAGSGATMTIGSLQTVQINGGRIFGDIINNGTIVSQALDANGSDIRDSIDQTGGGVIRADNGFARLVDATVTGGSFDSIGTGVVTAAGDLNEWDGVTNLNEAALESSAIVALLAGGLDNQGTLTINRTGATQFTILQATESASITGAGTIVINAPAPIWARLGSVSPAVLTIAPPQTVLLNGGRIFGDIVNEGTIISQTVEVTESEITGTVDQSAGGSIIGDNGFARLFDAAVTGGSFDSIGTGVVTAAGDLNEWDGVTNLNEAALESSAIVGLLAGGLDNQGTLTINRTGATQFTILQATESASITGAGTIVINGPAPIWARLGSVSPAVLTIAPPQTVLLNGGRVFGDIVNDGTIISQAETVAASEITGTVDQSAGGSIIGDNGFARLFDAAVTGGSFDSIGTGVVTAVGNAANAWDGVTNLNEAALESNATVSLLAGGLENNGTLTINRAGVTQFAVLQATESTSITGTGTIVLNGPDTIWARIGSEEKSVLTLEAGQTLTGNRGLTFGTVQTSGTLAPSGMDGVIRIEDSFSFLPGGTLRIGLESELGVPRLAGPGSAQLDIDDATLTITDEGFAPVAFFRATIVQGPTYNGRFAVVDGPALPSGLIWRVLYVDPTTIDIAATCPGDLNADAIVDTTDLGILLGDFGCQGDVCDADINGDGVVDTTDLGQLLGEFGSDC